MTACVLAGRSARSLRSIGVAAINPERVRQVRPTNFELALAVVAMTGGTASGEGCLACFERCRRETASIALGRTGFGRS